MRGTSWPHAKRTGDFGNAPEAIRIGDQFPCRVFAKNSEPCNFRLLQQYLPKPAVSSRRQLLFNHVVGADDMPLEARIELAGLMPYRLTYYEISRDDEIECGAKDTITQWDV